MILSAAVAQTSVGISQHDLDSALKILKEYLAIHADDSQAKAVVNAFEHDPADRDAGQQLLSEALNISPNAIEVNDALGTMLLGERHYPEAMDRFEAVLAVSSRDERARAGELEASTGLALQARAAGNREAALLCLQHAAEHLPDNVTLLIDTGLVEGELHLYSEAERSFRSALALEPKNSRLLYAAARVETDAGHLPQAERYMRDYLVIQPDDPTAHYGLGRVLIRELRVPEAQAEFERSIALQPLQVESYYELGSIALNSRKDDDAQRLFHKALERDPRHGGALTGLGQVAYREKNYPEARKQLMAATESSPDYQPAHYYLGLTLARLGEKEASARELAMATQLAHQQQSKADPVATPVLP